MTLMMERPGSTTCRPRFFTPRDDRFPTLGDEVAEVARRLGTPLMDWQAEFIAVAYEYDPDTGLFRYNEADATVPRQSGKTTITLAKKVHRLTAMARRLGPQRSTYTAQTRLAARKKLERDFAEKLRASRSFREVPNAKARPQRPTEWRLSLNNGSEAIQFGSGSFLQIDAPSRTGGHGDTLDDGTIDEAFAHEDDTVEASMRPAMATRENAQLWVISTAGDARSKYLWRKVLAGRAASESGEHGRVCYAEYSAPDDADPGDPATWWSCMPALGVTISEDFIRGEWERAQRKGPEGVKTFRRAYLNQWPDVPVLTADDRTEVLPGWSLLTAPHQPVPADAVFAVDVDVSRQGYIVAAWQVGGMTYCELGKPVPAHELAARVRAVAGVRPVACPPALVEELERGRVGVREVRAAEWPQACAALIDRVSGATLRHFGQAELDAAVDGLQPPRLSSSGAPYFVLKDSPGSGPVFALARAVFALSAATPSVYESREPIAL